MSTEKYMNLKVRAKPDEDGVCDGRSISKDFMKIAGLLGNCSWHCSTSYIRVVEYWL